MAIDERDAPSVGAGDDHLGDGRTRRRLAVATVAAVLVACGVLRAITAEAYVPWQHHWDEATNVDAGQRMSDDLSVDPGFYDYPALVFVTQAVVLVPASVLSGYDPDDDGPVIDAQNYGANRVDHVGLLRAMRWTTGILPQLVTALAAAAIAWVVTRRWYAPAIGALLVTLSAVDLRFGTFVTPDALSGMAATLAALGAVMVTLEPTRRRYLWTGVAIGLAAAAKYNAATVAIALVAAHLLTHKRPVAERRPLIEAAVAAAAVFALVNLGGVLHPIDFVREIGSEGVHYSTGHAGNEGNSAIFHATWLWRSFGLALPVAACSLLTRSATVRRASIVLLSSIAFYFVFLSLFPVRFARNLLPISGTIAAAAAIGLVVCAQRLLEIGPRRVAAIGAIGAVIVATLAVPVTGAAAALGEVDQDPWGETNAWLAENVPDGATIATEAYTPHVDESRFEVVAAATRLGNVDGGLEYYEDRGVDYFIASEEMFQPALDDPGSFTSAVRLYRQILVDECVVHEAEGAGHRLIVAEAPPCGP